MKPCMITLVITVVGMLQTFTSPVDSTFHQLVCQQCAAWCPMEQNVALKSRRTGNDGTRERRRHNGRYGSVECVDVPSIAAIEETIDVKLENFTAQIKKMIDNKIGLTGSCRYENPMPEVPRSCQDISLELAKSRNETGGVFDIFVPELGLKEVYCDVRTDGGNWIVFQRRMDGSVDYHRDWNDYAAGFGNLNGEFWLGLELIHQLTKSGNFELRIDMIEKNTLERRYAQYSTFRLGPGSDNYRLNVSGYSGNATDAFASPSDSNGRHNNQPFSTLDRDNDRNVYGNCARRNKGGWWFNSCYRAFLNGLYENRISWQNQSGPKWLKMKFAEMKFRQRL